MKNGFADLLQAARPNADFEETYWPILNAVRQLMDACEDSGEIRAGNNAENFLMLVGLMWRIPPTPVGEARVKRVLALALRGLGAEDAPDT